LSHRRSSPSLVLLFVERPIPIGCLDDDTIATFVAGSLDPALLPRIEEHLAGCAACRSAAAAGLAYGEATPPGIAVTAPDVGANASRPLVIAERFELRDLIAQGGMGVVYRGHDQVERELVAVKVIQPSLLASHPEIVQRFVREGEILRRLNHPNIVKMIAAVQHAGQQYIVLEYVAGGSLRDLLRRQRRLPVARAGAILLELSDALARAHHLNILHRDVKPENVLLAPDGTPRLSDFGLARSGDDRLTQENAILGTVAYLSPEALWGEALDPRADVWACGVMLFEMLAGRCPFEADTQAAMITAILQRDPPDLRALRPDAPPALIELVEHMLKKERAQRIASARQVAAELESILAGLRRGSLPSPKARALVTPPVEPTALAATPGGPEPIYGRSDVLERVRRAQEHVSAGSGRLLIVSGEAGIGKSFVVQRVLAEAAARGARTAWGRCWEAGGAPAYWPWLSVFRDLGLEDPFATAAAQLSGGALEARFAAFERAAQQLKASTSRRPLALALDDLHAADAPSLLFLLFLARELPRLPILVVAAHRAVDAAVAPELATLLAQIARDAEVCPLSRLSVEEVATWLRGARPGQTTRSAEELYRVTEGHPLLVAEVLRLSSDAFSEAAWPKPRAVLVERLARLSAETRKVLEVAAIWGREFKAFDLVSTNQLEPDQVFRALREARAASIVEASGNGEGLRFSHVLLRDQLYADLPPSVRSALHLEVGKLLATREEPRAAIYHLLEGCQETSEQARSELATLVAPVAIAAAEAALAHWAFEDASRLGRRTLASFAAGGLSERARCELDLVVAEALIRQGDMHEGKVVCTQAAERAERAGASDLFARAALVYSTELSPGTIDEGMVSRLRNALDRLEPNDSPLRARVMARLATALTPVRTAVEGEEAVALLRSAAEVVRRQDDRHALLYVLQVGTHLGTYLPEAERFELARDSLALAIELGQPLAAIRTLPAYVTILAARGEQARADAELADYDEILTSFPQPLHRVRRLLVDCLLANLRGDFERAERANASARAIAERPGAGAAWHHWLVHQVSRAQLLARPELLRAEAPALLEHANKSKESGTIAWLLAVIGREAEAREHLRLVPQAHPWSYGMITGAEACVLLKDTSMAEPIYSALAVTAKRMVFAGGAGTVFGPTGRTLGDLALLLGRRADALRHYDEAIAYTERLPFPPLLALCHRAREAAATAEFAQDPRG
jgi:tetratricopeptide (TPR) repeat protein